MSHLIISLLRDLPLYRV